MSRRVITILLFSGAFLQTLLCAPTWLGSYEWPILLSLVLCISLKTDLSRVLYTGALAGILHDSFCQSPLGGSLPFFILVSFGMYFIREEIFVDLFIAYFFFGFLGGMAKAFYFTFFYLLTGLREVSVTAFLAHFAENVLFCTLITPIVYLIVNMVPRRDRRSAGWLTR